MSARSVTTPPLFRGVTKVIVPSLFLLPVSSGSSPYVKELEKLLPSSQYTSLAKTTPWRTFVPAPSGPVLTSLLNLTFSPISILISLYHRTCLG